MKGLVASNALFQSLRPIAVLRADVADASARTRNKRLDTPAVHDMYYTGWAIKNRTCLSVDNSAVVTRRKVSYMSKVLECCIQRGPNLHSKLFKYSLPNLHKSSLPLKLGICMHSQVPEFIEFKKLTAKKSR